MSESEIIKWEEHTAWADGLKSQYPEFFPSNKYVEFAVGPGWYKIIEDLLSDIKSLLQPEQSLFISQVKEKFGGLRFYCGGNYGEEVSRLIGAAGRKASLTCEVCGKEGKTHTIRGWMRTVCEEHKQEPA
jgi:hypothetical protein